MKNETKSYYRQLTALALVAIVMAQPESAWGSEETSETGPATPFYVKQDTWQGTMLASRVRLAPVLARQDAIAGVWKQIERDFPIAWDWVLQDIGGEFLKWFGEHQTADIETPMIAGVLDELGPDGESLRTQLDRLVREDTPASDRRWLDLYVNACEKRRAGRLARLVEKYPKIVFTKHYNLGGSHYAYTEGQSDAQRERHFTPGSSLCLLELDGIYGNVHTLLTDPDGVIRDPDVSYDGNRILFAWKKSDRLDDYHLHEMDLSSGTVRQLTFGLGFADYESVYLPCGDILFTSSRWVQTVDCWWTEVSNMYRCAADGRFLRRLSFDQVHANYPQVLEDGRVVYTRWDYNDRGQIYPQPLYQMNPDGTGQTEFYGNNSWFPTTIMHARGIPGTQKVVAVLSGHHSHQRGKLAIIDPARGRQEASGVQLIAPVRDTPAERIDAYGQDGDQFQYPYPVSGTEYLVTYDPIGSERRKYDRTYGIYLMNADGRRELLAWDPEISSSQPVPLAPRSVSRRRSSPVDYRSQTGTYYLQDIYLGPGLDGIPRGTIKSLRVVALEFRAAGVGSNNNRGPAGGALVSTPISVGNGTWDVKRVLGEAGVYEDGSACFTVPARMPVYFQALDEKRHVVQTMRTWSTLQPGETMACVGCHESKNESVAYAGENSLALDAGPQPLEPFYGPARGFSFPKEIQPILDRNCIRCHDDRSRARHLAGAADETPAEASPDSSPERAFSLLAGTTIDPRAKRQWSDAYLALTNATFEGKKDKGSFRGTSNEMVNWISVQSAPEMLPPYDSGAARSRLISILDKGHYEVKLSREEMDKIACWIDLLVPYCGDYTEANAWSEAERAMYARFQAKRDQMAAVERKNVEALVSRGGDLSAESSRKVVPGTYRNVALNTEDHQGRAQNFPHASSNSEYNDLAWFAACSAIDGQTDNQGHGRKYPSWGPHKRTDLWWKVEFGRPVTIDKLVLIIRADFPHDKHWHSATIEFSDGSRQTIKIAKTAQPQAFRFEPRTVDWLKLTNLVQHEPLGWCALTEVEVWGRDHDARAGKP